MALVSLDHNLIFLKTRKTAGTSIETDLSQRLEPRAIVTPIFPPMPGHEARNYQNEQGEPLYFNHMHGRLVRDRLGAEKFNSMTRICVEREPVRKCISYFHMMRNSALHNPDGAYQHSWDEFVEAGDFPIDLDMYSEVKEGRRVSLVTHILRHDRLEVELPALLADLGIPDFILKSRAKSEYSRNVLITPDQVTPAQRARIENAYRETTQFLGQFAGIDWSQP